jgi:hypothetical protein
MKKRISLPPLFLYEFGLSARGPVHVPSRKQVKMDMKYRLSGIGIGVRHDPETAFVVAPLPGKFRGNSVEMADQEVVFRLQLKCICNMFSRNQQKMKRCNGIEILYGYQFIILIDRFGWDFAGDYPAEKTVHFHPPN